MQLSDATLQPINPPGTTISPGVHGLEQILSVALGLLTIIGGLMFVTWFIIGGYNWLTAEGKPEKIEKARNHILQALVGFIIIIGAYAIAGVIGLMLGINIFDLEQVVDNLIK